MLRQSIVLWSPVDIHGRVKSILRPAQKSQKAPWVSVFDFVSALAQNCFHAVTYLCERCGKRWEDAGLGTRTTDAMPTSFPPCGTRIETFHIDGVETIKETIPNGDGKCKDTASCRFFRKYL